MLALRMRSILSVTYAQCNRRRNFSELVVGHDAEFPDESRFRDGRDLKRVGARIFREAMIRRSPEENEPKASKRGLPIRDRNKDPER